MAEEDLIFGKNRHMFGGIEPSNMLSFSATSMYDFKNNRPTNTITASLPLDTIVDGQTLCSVAGAVICKKTTGYPENEFDGEIIADITEDTKVLDMDVTIGTTYYYAAFPYSDLGVFNRNPVSKASVTTKDATYIFGFDIDLSDPNPATRVTYPSDVDNAAFTPAGMNFEKLVFNYGDWPSEAGLMFMPRPCMLNNDGTVYEYLDPNDYTKNVNGQPSKASDTSFNGNAMMEWPKIYYRRGEKTVGSSTHYTFHCSNKKIADDWDCWCNYDINNNEIDHFYTAIYRGTTIDGKLRSIGGQSYTNTNGNITSYSDYVAQAKTNGSDWLIDAFADHLLIYDLLIMLGKSTDTIGVFGTAKYIDSLTTYPNRYDTGRMDSFGLFYSQHPRGGIYTPPSDVNGIKVFGMEDLWGFRGRFLIGLFRKRNGTPSWYYFKITRGTHDGSTATDYSDTLDVTGYISGGQATSHYNQSFTGYWGATSKIGYLPSGAAIMRMPSTPFEGSITTYDCTYETILSIGSTETQAVGAGYPLNNGGYAGYISHTYGTGSYTMSGSELCAALSCKPTKIV